MTGEAIDYSDQDRCPSARPAVGGLVLVGFRCAGEKVDDVLCEGTDPGVLVVGGGPEDLERFIVRALVLAHDDPDGGV